MANAPVQTRMTLMRRLAFKQELLSAALVLLVIVAAIWLGVDGTMAVAVGLTAYAFWHLFNATRLFALLLGGRGAKMHRTWGIWRDASDQVRRLQEREHRRKRRQQRVFSRIRKMAAAMPDGVVIFGSNGELSWFNRQAGVYLGLQGDALLGRRLVDLVEHPVLRDYLQAGKFTRGLQVEAPGDPATILAINVTRFKKRRERYLLVARDITQQYHLNRNQRDFTLNVSHELRTPLTVIYGYLETLSDSEESESPRRLPLVRMKEQVQRMQGVIQDLFILSKLEDGAETIRQQPVAVLDLLQQVVRDGEQQAQETQHELKLNGDTGLWLRGDASLLRCACSNLVSNAIRHTPAHTLVEITWSRDGDQAVLQVRDNGAGIPARHLPRLTERFYRVDVGRSREAGGTGLGLAIVRQILEMHDARLLIHSDEGRGSSFACRFPAARICQPAGEALGEASGTLGAIG